MIYITCGLPGRGKTAINASKIYDTYWNDGQDIYARMCHEIIEINKDRKYKLSIPDRVPIFSNFQLKFKVNSEKSYEPYFVNPYYLGLPMSGKDVMYLPPFSKIFITEAQRYFNSRLSSTFPAHVSRYFELQRHWGIDIYLDTQRAGLIDKNIRDLCSNYEEVIGMDNRIDSGGEIESSSFYTQVFDSFDALEAYYATGAVKDFRLDFATLGKPSKVFKGNLFRFYDSFFYKKMFLPPDEPGIDWTLLSFEDPKKEELNKYYSEQEPEWYRGAKNGK